MGKCLPNWPRLYFTFSMAMFFAFSSSCGRFLSGKMYNQFNIIIIDTHHITSCGNWKVYLIKNLAQNCLRYICTLAHRLLRRFSHCWQWSLYWIRKKCWLKSAQRDYNRVAVELGWKEILFFIDTCCFYWYLLTYK